LDSRELGRRGEDLAAEFLMGKGWTLVGRNVRVGHREVDIIATRGAILAFVEVKTRRGKAFGTPLESISPRKMRDVARAAAGWLRERGGCRGRRVRFDAVSVSWPSGVAPEIIHVPDAWRLE
jgi:putative endonuclease